MSIKIEIDPLTRISGLLKIQVNIDNKKIVDARTVGSMFRGFELMLKGRDPLDAIYFTERICGICSTAHGYVSVKALENGLNIKVENNAKFMRDFIHGCEFLQNHIRHFYLFVIPDYIKGPNINPVHNEGLKDYRLPNHIDNHISQHYIEALEYSKRAHEMLALLAGKAPHAHGIYLGGVTSNIDAIKYEELKWKLNSIKEFVKYKMIEDAYTISRYYEDYFKKGNTGRNFLSYGLFDDYEEKELFYVKPSVMINGVRGNLDREKIKENIHYAWYDRVKDQKGLGENLSIEESFVDDREKPEAYSFVKAARYDGHSMEVGPLARMTLSGLYTRGNSTMDRIIARALEAFKLCEIMEGLLERIMENFKNGIINKFYSYDIPASASGISMRDTTRGALLHSLEIKSGVIDNYAIITPSTWNLGPEALGEEKGVVEKALIGTDIEDENNPVEVGRIVRSFDPCISCATHVYIKGKKYLKYEILK